MQYLEERDRQDRSDGTGRLQRLRQIPEETGRFLAMLVSMAPDGAFVEVGTSGGYSALWLSLACRRRGCPLTTFEVLPEKIAIATETFRAAGVEDVVTLVQGDAREQLAEMQGIAFCFIDAEKEYYAELYELVVPRLVSGGIVVADNAISHGEELKPVIDRALADARVDALVVPIGKGELLVRKA